jgi:aspartyl-tRNA(Asn)/glutamyl-tRNA(Gln) amidotransferase subunit A
MAVREVKTLESLKQEFESGKLNASEHAMDMARTIEACETSLKALVHVTTDSSPNSWKFNSEQPYSGISYVQKNNICTRDVNTDCCSRILQGFIPPYSATADQRLQDAGFRLAGKSNMDEFGMGSSTEYSCYGPTLNPYDTSRVSGGSSGGSAAAVAAGYAPLALGSDTGGSVRQPAAFCGLVGLRPTYGRVSRWGLIAFASSLDQIGPITNTVRDSAIALSIIEGPDGFDSTIVETEKIDYLKGIEDGISDMRVGVLDVGMADWVDSRVKDVHRVNIDWFKKNAKSVETISLKTFNYILAAYYIIAPSEASSNLARFDGVRYGPSVDIAPVDSYGDENSAAGLLDFYRKNRSRGFGDEVTRRILIGTFALSSGYYDAYYLKAQKVRTLVRAELDEIWKKVDVVISPTTPTPPFKLGECTENPMDMYRADMFSLFQPIAGCPAISINGGWTDKDDNGSPLKKNKDNDCFGTPVTKLPIGLQITSSPFNEAVLLRAARAFERDHE